MRVDLETVMTPAMLFRKDTDATRVINKLLLSTCTEYAKKIIEKPLNEILIGDVDIAGYEIQPSRIKEIPGGRHIRTGTHVLPQKHPNVLMLEQACNKVINAMIESLPDAPQALCVLAAAVVEETEKKFPGDGLKALCVLLHIFTCTKYATDMALVSSSYSLFVLHFFCNKIADPSSIGIDVYPAIPEGKGPKTVEAMQTADARRRVLILIS